MKCGNKTVIDDFLLKILKFKRVLTTFQQMFWKKLNGQREIGTNEGLNTLEEL